MKLLRILLLLLASVNLYSVEYCDNFKIVSILDFPPSLKTPGGNYFLLLLTVNEDNPDNLTNYTNLFFISNSGDTISIPTGPSSHLPIFTKDTIPYILVLNNKSSNNDFPEDFSGKLVIINPSQGRCEVDYTNIVSSVKIDDDGISIYPNPLIDYLKVESDEVISEITLIDFQGKELQAFHPSSKKAKLNLTFLTQGAYFLKIEQNDGTQIIRKVIKM